MAVDRSQMLLEMLEKSPGDAFARYALAMELTKKGDTAGALQQYQALISFSPDYVPAYQMAGQLQAGVGDNNSARQWLEQGIQIASRTGNIKARREMEDLLDELSGDG